MQTRSKSFWRRLADKEEEFFSNLIERWAEKEPETFWPDDAPRPKRWEGLLVKYWPRILTLGYWYWLLSYLDGSRNEYGYSTGDSYPNWINWPTWGEWRYLGETGGWGDVPKRRSLKWAWIQLTDETKGRRLICRLRGHPNGEIYYNPGGDEPDHRCKDCGEEIG